MLYEVITDDITPLVEREIKGPIGDYLAQEVVERISRSDFVEKLKEEKAKNPA